MNIEPAVYIVDDELWVRRLLTELVQSVNLRVEAFQSAPDFLAAAATDAPGCVVLDMRMPAMSGLQLQQRLISLGSPMQIVFLTGNSDVPTAVQAMKAGAFDFVEKPFKNQRVLDTIQAALQKSAEMESIKQRKAEARSRVASLSSREEQVLKLVIDGKPSKVIARLLDISPKTIEYHRANIMRKMEANSIADLVRNAGQSLSPAQ